MRHTNAPFSSVDLSAGTQPPGAAGWLSGLSIQTGCPMTWTRRSRSSSSSSTMWNSSEEQLAQLYAGTVLNEHARSRCPESAMFSGHFCLRLSFGASVV